MKRWQRKSGIAAAALIGAPVRLVVSAADLGLALVGGALNAVTFPLRYPMFWMLKQGGPPARPAEKNHA